MWNQRESEVENKGSKIKGESSTEGKKMGKAKSEAGRQAGGRRRKRERRERRDREKERKHLIIMQSVSF